MEEDGTLEPLWFRREESVPEGMILVNENAPKILFVSFDTLTFPVMNMASKPPKPTLAYRDRSEPLIYQTKR